MTAVILSIDGIELGFADGSSGMIPFGEIPEIERRAAVRKVGLPNPYELVIEIADGGKVEILWDFARHYCDESYTPAAIAAADKGRRAFGEQIRSHRQFVGWTQQHLAEKADMGRAALARIENGGQSPGLKTLKSIADALGTDVTGLLVERELRAREPARLRTQIGQSSPAGGQN